MNLQLPAALPLVLILALVCACGDDARADTDTGPGDRDSAAADTGTTGGDTGTTDTGARDTGTAEDGGRAVGPCPMPPPDGYAYEVGVSVFGANDYIEYMPGDLPIIIAAPHGGTLEPAELPSDDSLARDSGSRETALLVRDRFRELTGRSPHVIINHVARNRLNLARPDARPNEDVPSAVIAWNEFHGFVEEASVWVTAACGSGHYYDFHTNGHDGRWVEVGTGLAVSRLEMSDAELTSQAGSSYYRALAERPGISFVEVVRGPTSLGGLLEGAGVRAVPTPRTPDPGGMEFFIGGYNPGRHGSRDGGVIDATHLEMHFSYINAGGAEREAFAATLTSAMRVFMENHYGFDLDAR